MNNKLFVGGLSFSTTQQDLIDLFSQAGEVKSANIIMDKMTNSSKGFGFVEMATAEQAQKAIDMFNQTEFNGRKISVNEARPQAPRTDYKNRY